MKRWAGLTVRRIHLGTFDYTVHVVIGPQDKAVAYIQSFFKEPAGTVQLDPTRRGLCAHHFPYCPVVWVPRRPTTAREHATVAHEALHAVGHAMRWAGIEYSESTEEVFCHALGCLVNGITNP